MDSSLIAFRQNLEVRRVSADPLLSPSRGGGMRVLPHETKAGVAQKHESCFPGLALNYRVISYNEVKGLARLEYW